MRRIDWQWGQDAIDVRACARGEVMVGDGDNGMGETEVFRLVAPAGLESIWIELIKLIKFDKVDKVSACAARRAVV